MRGDRRREYGPGTLLVVLGIFVVLPTLLSFCTSSVGPNNPQARALSNLKQLHLATQQMALDGQITGDTNLGWPGDTGGSYSQWMHKMVPDYLATNDFGHLVSLRGRSVARDHLPAMKDTAILVYAVRADSPSNTVFLSTANFINTPDGGGVNASALIITNQFVIMRKDGSSAILSAKQAGATNIIGAYAPLCR